MGLKEALVGIGLLTSGISYGQAQEFTEVKQKEIACIVNGANSLDGINEGPTIYGSSDDRFMQIDNIRGKENAEVKIVYGVDGKNLHIQLYADEDQLLERAKVVDGDKSLGVPPEQFNIVNEAVCKELKNIMLSIDMQGKRQKI